MPVRFFTRLFRLVWGAEVDRALRPLLAVSLVGAAAGSTLWVFIGIWAVEELGASRSALGVAFFISAVLGAVGAYVAGHLSDRIGRKPIILWMWGGEAVFPLALLAAGERTLAGLTLIALAGLIFAGHSVTQALVADLVAPERHEAAYASVRVATNLGITLGPPIGGLLLLGRHWPTLFVGVSALCFATFLLALRLLPSRGRFAPETKPERGSFRLIVRDRPFLVFFASGVLASLVYSAFETVLPVSLVETHGLEPAAWGFLMVINPALVTLFQLRVTTWTSGVPAAVKLPFAMLLMGLPFLLLSVSAAVPVVALIIFVFVIGEMLWIPTSQAVVAALAPEDVRGAYMGAFGSTWAIAFALGPFSGLQIGHAYGDAATWVFFAVVSVAAAVMGAAACLVTLGRRPAEPLEAPATT